MLLVHNYTKKVGLFVYRVEQSEEDATLEGATVCSFELVEKLQVTNKNCLTCGIVKFNWVSFPSHMQNVGVNAADIKKLKEGYEYLSASY